MSTNLLFAIHHKTKQNKTKNSRRERRRENTVTLSKCKSIVCDLGQPNKCTAYKYANGSMQCGAQLKCYTHSLSRQQIDMHVINPP